MLVEADAADEAIAMTQAEPRGIVRLTCPVAMLESSVGDMLAAYLIRYPLVELQVYATNRRVDVVGEGIDIAIRVRPPPLEDSDLVLRTLSESNQCLVASPDHCLPAAADYSQHSDSSIAGFPCVSGWRGLACWRCCWYCSSSHCSDLARRHPIRRSLFHHARRAGLTSCCPTTGKHRRQQPMRFSMHSAPDY